MDKAMGRRVVKAVCLLLGLILLSGALPAVVAAADNAWTGSGPFATGLANREILALAVSDDGATVYAGTGSGTVFIYSATKPTATTEAATNQTWTSATLNGTVNAKNADTTVTFEYGATTAYGSTAAATPATATGTTDTAVTADLTGLTTGSTIHYRVRAENSSGVSYGSDVTFTAGAFSTTFTYGTASSFTLDVGGTPVLAETGALPTGIAFVDNGDGTATLSGTPNAAGTFVFTVTADNGGGSTTSQTFTLTVTPPDTANLSASDPDIAVSPDRYLFGTETIGDCSASTAIPFTVTNTGSSVLSLGSLGFGGVDSDQFSLAGDACSGTTLNPGTTCTVNVKFCPTSTGSKAAVLQIPSSAPKTPVLDALLYNGEPTCEEASRRLPPVLDALSIPEVMTGGSTYTITWSLLGYDSDYVSRVVFFNCSGVAAGTCGANFSGNFEDSGNLSTVTSEAGTWSYGSLPSTKFDYSYTFTAPSVTTDTTIVIRFYEKSRSDDAAGLGSLSLLVPGNLVPAGTSYYDAQGRRLSHAVTP